MAETAPIGRRSQLRQRQLEALTGYLFVAPDVLGLLVFVVIPIFYAAWVSLHSWDAIGPMVWVGLKNYASMLRDRQWHDALRVTLVYTVVFVPLLFALSLGVALLVQQKLVLRGAFRTAYFSPVVFSLVVAAIMWSYIFDQQSGLLNYVLHFFGIKPQAWLGSVKLALPSVTTVSLWAAVGYYMVIFLAGLQDIPRDYYEAARIDGGSGWQIFWRITLPLLRPTSIFVLITTTIGAVQVFDQVYVLTSGGPANATQVSVYYIYLQAFQFSHIGYSSALAFVLFAIIFGLSLAQLRFFRTGEAS